ncbi:LysM peptidoglycan-binding domain-containing protein [Weissella confusa]|uniref:aggregation-promoting factor C-terminal-like domain-containing protein n=1 Tax=Weissella confusa TaxID=1583 RepID=UPI00107F9242|nr:LysM peptidoglycan-binding domain-containing protein [Weissella confusa]TGE71999.1 peptidoglycan-binding protein [Weissella confusa]
MDNTAYAYVIKQGDTLSQIAASHGTDAKTLGAINQISDINFIVVGQTLHFTSDEVKPTANYSANTVDQSMATQPAEQATNQPATPTGQAAQPVANTANASGSTYDQFITNGGTQAMWNAIVMPESGGNPDAVSPNGYHGLGQTKQSWGYGDVASQTQGMINYANSRYGSVDGAVAFRQANGWW